MILILYDPAINQLQKIFFLSNNLVARRLKPDPSILMSNKRSTMPHLHYITDDFWLYNNIISINSKLDKLYKFDKKKKKDK